jgi:hypothetical protein
MGLTATGLTWQQWATAQTPFMNGRTVRVTMAVVRIHVHVVGIVMDGVDGADGFFNGADAVLLLFSLLKNSF